MLSVFGFITTDIQSEPTKTEIVAEAEEVPLLDLSDFYAGDDRMKERFVQEFGDGLNRVGFVRLKNHGISKQAIERAKQSAEEFFALPLEEKVRYEGVELNRGYKSYHLDRKDKVSDLQEYWHVGPLTPRENAVWPEDLDGFEDNLSELYREIAWHGEPILEACSLYMGKEADFLSHLTAQGDSVMRIVHYLPSESDGGLWKAAHRDPNLITIVVGASKEGLQVQTREGNWIDVPYDPDEIVVSASNMLESLSNGLIRSAPHRVQMTESETPRFAIPFFFHVQKELSIGPQEESIEKTGGEALYPEQTAGEALKDHRWFSSH